MVLAGETALVGARFADVSGTSNQGAVYIFMRTASTWSEQGKLVGADGAANDNFGVSAALHGNTAVVGAWRADVGGNNWGAAYVFSRSRSTWSQEEKLVAADGAVDDNFGRSVAVDGDMVVAGAPRADVNLEADQGAAYVFTRSGTTWSLEQKLWAEARAAGDTFGISVAAAGDATLVGASGAGGQGAAYVFIRSGSIWSQGQKLAARDGAAGDFFGGSVALAGDTAVVSAPFADVSVTSNVGKIYLADRGPVPWPLSSTIEAADGAADDFFCFSVAVDDDRAVVGAYRADVFGRMNTGAAYVFTRSGTVWNQEQKLFEESGAAATNFGRSVAVSGNTATVGASIVDVGGEANQGRAYFFERQPVGFAVYLPLLVRN